MKLRVREASAASLRSGEHAEGLVEGLRRRAGHVASQLVVLERGRSS